MKHSSITLSLMKARNAFAKAARALPEYEALQQARAAYDRRQTTLEAAQRLLKSLLKSKAAVSAEQLALLRRAATDLGYEELGRDRVDDIIRATDSRGSKAQNGRKPA
jgi:hypothetical protein